MLRTGRVGENVEAMAQRLLCSYGGLAQLAAASVAELARGARLGPVRAAAVGAAFGLARRLVEVRFRPGAAIHSGQEVAGLVRESVRGSRRESFFALLLDARHRVISLRLISTGGLESAPVHPRELFAAAIRESAAAIVVAHNHPSGDPTPSSADRALTERLRQAGVLLGIELLDHVVVGDDRYFSLAEDRAVPIC